MCRCVCVSVHKKLEKLQTLTAQTSYWYKDEVQILDSDNAFNIESSETNATVVVSKVTITELLPIAEVMYSCRYKTEVYGIDIITKSESTPTLYIKGTINLHVACMYVCAYVCLYILVCQTSFLTMG